MLNGNACTMFVKKRSLIFLVFLPVILLGCAQLEGFLTPTNVDRNSYQPECKRSWRNKTVLIDFNTTYYYWHYEYASSLATEIKERLIEDIVEDGCFKVQDIPQARTRYYYKIKIQIGSPYIRVRDGILEKISAKFRIKTYNRRNNLIKAASRYVKYERPAFVLVVNDSQEELLQNYSYNVSTRIREAFYQSIGGRAKNKTVAGGKYKTSAKVNFRTGPSTRTLIIRKLKKNTFVYPTGKIKGNWWQVEINGDRGWLHKTYIKKYR